MQTKKLINISHVTLKKTTFRFKNALNLLK